jgi:glutamine amidotransferase
MQLLFDTGLEFGEHAGLGIISGRVVPIPQSDSAGTRKVPHIGWSPLLLPAGREGWGDTVLADAVPGVTSAYFVHSFTCEPDDPTRRLAEVDYAGFRVCAAVQQDNLTAFQCHPEKSGTAGLQVIARFLAE